MCRFVHGIDIHVGSPKKYSPTKATSRSHHLCRMTACITKDGEVFTWDERHFWGMLLNIEMLQSASRHWLVCRPKWSVGESTIILHFW